MHHSTSLTRLLQAILVLLLAHTTLGAQELSWQLIGPYGGSSSSSFRSITIDSGGTIYAVDQRRVASRSIDGGHTWELIAASGQFDDVRAVGADTVYAVTSGTTLIRSTDAGVSWNGVGAVPASWLPDGDGGLRAVTITEGRTRLVDIDADGTIGTRVIDAPFGLELLWRRTDGAYLARLADTLVLSTDDGAVWSTVAVGVAATSPVHVVGETRSGSLLLVDDSAGVWRSTDGGASWSARTRVPGTRAMSVAVDADGALYVSMIEGLYSSTDDGATWVDTGSRTIMSLLAVGDELLGSRPITGPIRSIDGGRTWTNSNAGLPGVSIGSITVVGDTALVVAGPYHHSRWSAATGTWSDGLAIARDAVVTALPDGLTVAYSPRTRQLYRSTDAGLTWDTAGATGPNVAPLIGIDRTGALVMAGETTWRSTDRGDSWMPYDTSASGRVFGAIVRDSTGRLLSFHRNQLVAYDEAVGRWTPLADPPTLPNGATGLQVTPSGAIVIATWSDGLLRSVDQGATWQQMAAPDSGLERIRVDRSGTLVAMAGVPLRLFVSRDLGSTWRSISSNLTSGVSTFELASSGRVYAGTMLGVARSEESVAGVGGEVTSRGVRARLAPNPTTSRATLTLDLDAPSSVRATIVSAGGHIVRTLHDGVLAPGAAHIVVTTDGLAAGAYFVRLELDDRSTALPLIVR